MQIIRQCYSTVQGGLGLTESMKMVKDEGAAYLIISNATDVEV